MTQDGRTATQPYRVRVGGTWYWVDPTVPRQDLEPGDMVLIYCGSEAALAILQSPLAQGEAVSFRSPQGETFQVAAAEIAALHLAAVDEVQ